MHIPQMHQFHQSDVEFLTTHLIEFEKVFNRIKSAAFDLRSLTGMFDELDNKPFPKPTPDGVIQKALLQAMSDDLRTMDYYIWNMVEIHNRLKLENTGIMCEKKGQNIENLRVFNFKPFGDEFYKNNLKDLTPWMVLFEEARESFLKKKEALLDLVEVKV